MTQTLKDIEQFTLACDNMANSKFILVDKRIGDLLKAIAQTKPVYNTVAECVINFNFDNEWKIATAKRGELRLPEDGKKLVAFVFFMLNNIDSGKINISTLLMQHFSHDEDKRSSYTVFCEKAILPFKENVVNMICPPKVVKANKQTTTEPQKLQEVSVTEDVVRRLEFLTKDVKEYVYGLKKIKGCPVTKQNVMQQIELLLFTIKCKEQAYIVDAACVLINLAGRDKELIERLRGILELAQMGKSSLQD